MNHKIIILLTLACLIAGYYLQYVVGLVPCPLCLMQRICMMGILLSSLFLLRWDYSNMRLFRAFWVIAGFFFSIRHLWLQSLPPGSVPACMPGLDILMAYFSWSDVAKAMLWGGGDCAKVTYRLFGLSLAAWSFLYFLAIGLITAFSRKHVASR